MRLTNRSYEAIERGALVEAEQHLETGLVLDPDNPYTLLNMGYVFQQTGRYDEAREVYQKLIALHSDEKPNRLTAESLKGPSPSGMISSPCSLAACSNCSCHADPSHA